MSLITFGAQTSGRVQAHRELLRRDRQRLSVRWGLTFPSLTVAIFL